MPDRPGIESSFFYIDDDFAAMIFLSFVDY